METDYSRILAKKSHVLIRDFESGKLDPDTFFKNGLVSLIAFIEAHPLDFISSGEFHDLEGTYSEVSIAIQKSGFDSRFYDLVYDAVVGYRSKEASQKALLESRESSEARVAARKGTHLKTPSARVNSGGVHVTY